MNIAHLLARKGPKVVTIGPEQTIRQALALLAEHNIGALVVVDEGGRPAGILSERDIARAAVQDEAVFLRRVRSIMSTRVTTGTPEDDLFFVGHTMTDEHIRHLPVMDRDRLVGIVSIGDVVKAERDRYQGEVDTLQNQLLTDKRPRTPGKSKKSGKPTKSRTPGKSKKVGKSRKPGRVRR